MTIAASPLSSPPSPARRVLVPAGERFAPSGGSYDAQARTVELVIATETMVRTPGWVLGLREDFYYEVLDCSPAAVDLSQVTAGNCPALDAHRRASINDRVGNVADGRCEAKTVVIKVELGRSAAAQTIEAELEAGTAPKVSAGYTRDQVQFERMEGEVPVYRVTRWTLREASFVPIAADPNAGIRSPNLSVFPCNLVERTADVPQPFTPPHNPSAPPASGAASIAHIRMATDMLANFGFSTEQRAELALDFAERGASADEVTETIMRHSAEAQRRATGALRTGAILEPAAGGGSLDNPQVQSRAIEEAIFCRMTGRAPEPGSAAREYMGLSMAQIASDMLIRAGVRDVHRMSVPTLFETASWNRVGARAAWLAERGAPGHTTSDFPDLLLAAGQRHLLATFAIAASAVKSVARERLASDFREIHSLQLSHFQELEKVGEGGEIKFGTFKERKEKYRVETWARVFGLTFQALTNDDLGAFSDPLRDMALIAADKEANILADLINSNPALGDGKATFHADHKNLAAAGAAPSEAGLDEARLAMRSQKDANGTTPIAAAPKYILAAPKHETAIEKLLASISPANSANVNPFAGKLEPLIDPRLDPDPWHLFADPAMTPVLEYAYLEGKPGPQVEMRDGWRVLGQEYRVVLHFGAGVVGHVGGFRNPGA